MEAVLQSTGEVIALDAKWLLGAGGEARIYVIPPAGTLAAKVYHQPTLERAAKLAIMVENPPEDPSVTQGHVSIAWPFSLLLSADERRTTIGYVMPRVKGMHPLVEFYNPRSRRERCPLFHYRYLHRTARNLAAAVQAVHARGYVIGDVNESNILVSETALVTLVDTDSFQVRDRWRGTLFPCPVGKPEFTPPELQGVHLSEVERSQQHDLFGLAVLFFQLLMQGVHPFAGVYTGDGDPPPYEGRIRAGHFPYAVRGQVPYRPPRLAPPFHILDPGLCELFLKCFEDGHKNPAARPDAATWQRVLDRAEQALVACPANSQHLFGSHLPECPWCKCARAWRGLDPFPPRGATSEAEQQKALPPATQGEAAAAEAQEEGPAASPPASTYLAIGALVAAVAALVPGIRLVASLLALALGIAAYLLGRACDNLARIFAPCAMGLGGLMLLVFLAGAALSSMGAWPHHAQRPPPKPDTALAAKKSDGKAPPPSEETNATRELRFAEARRLAGGESPDYRAALRLLKQNLDEFPGEPKMDRELSWALLCQAHLGLLNDALGTCDVLSERYRDTLAVDEGRNALNSATWALLSSHSPLASRVRYKVIVLLGLTPDEELRDIPELPKDMAKLLEQLGDLEQRLGKELSGKTNKHPDVARLRAERGELVQKVRDMAAKSMGDILKQCSRLRDAAAEGEAADKLRELGRQLGRVASVTGNRDMLTRLPGGTELWELWCGSSVVRDMTLDGTRLLVRSQGAGSRLHCLDAETGTELWRFGDGVGGVGEAVADGGRVYVAEAGEGAEGLQQPGAFPPAGAREPVAGNGRHAVWCLDAQDGITAWEFRAEGSPRRLLAADGRVFAEFGKLHCLGAADGKEVWRTADDAKLLCVGEGRAYAFGAAKVQCLDTTDGKVAWTAGIEDHDARASALSGGRLYVMGSRGRVECLDALRGTRLWQSEAAPAGHTSSLHVRPGCIYVSDTAGSVTCLDALKGSRVWGEPSVGSAAVRFVGPVLVRATGEGVVALNPGDGAQVWSVPLGAAGQPLRLAAGGGWLYIAYDVLQCLSAAGGKRLWQAPFRETTTAMEGDDTGRLYLGSSDGKVRCYWATEAQEPPSEPEATEVKEALTAEEAETLAAFRRALEEHGTAEAQRQTEKLGALRSEAIRRARGAADVLLKRWPELQKRRQATLAQYRAGSPQVAAVEQQIDELRRAAPDVVPGRKPPEPDKKPETVPRPAPKKETAAAKDGPRPPVRYHEEKRLGVQLVELTPELAPHLDCEATEGLLVTSVAEQSPAEKAGLKQRDVILAVSGRDGRRPVRTAAQLAAELAHAEKTGLATVVLSFKREGKELGKSLRLKGATGGP